MTLFSYNNQSWYIDEKLRRNLEKRIITDLQKRDKDICFCIDGRERGGKSVFAQNLTAYLLSRLNTPFDITNICMTPEEFRNKIKNCVKNSVIIYDEAHRGMGSSGSLSEVNRILKDLMMEMGQKNLCVLIVIPTFFLLEKYVALFRTKGLFHIYEHKGSRGFWRYYNEKNKQTLYIRGKKEFNYNCIKPPRFKGRFSNRYVVNEAEYRKKKADSFKKAVRTTKSEKYLEQRNILIYILYKELKISEKKLSELLISHGYSLKPTSIHDIIAKIRDTSL